MSTRGVWPDEEGTFLSDQWRWTYTAKVDHQISNGQSMFVRYARENEDRPIVTATGTLAPSASFDFAVPRDSAVVAHTWVMGERALNDLRFQYGFSKYILSPPYSNGNWGAGDFPADRTGLFTPEFRYPSLSIGSANTQMGPERRWQIKDDFSYLIPDWGGSHQWKMGVDYNYITFQADGSGGTAGNWTFPKDAPYNPNDPTTWPTQYTDRLPDYGDVPVHWFSTYVQDDWQPARGVTINMGLRWDLQRGNFNEVLYEDLLPRVEKKLGPGSGSFPLPIPFHERDPITGSPYSARGDWNNVAPRIGVAWDPGADGLNNIHAGYGLFYESIRTLTTSFGEIRWPQAKTVIIRNPSFPDPYQGRSREQFITTAPPNISVMSNDFINPYAHQFAVGFTRMVSRHLAATIDLSWVDRYADRDIVDLNLPALGTRPYPQFGRVSYSQSSSNNTYRALLMKIEKRLADNYQLMVSYTLSKADDLAVLNVEPDFYGFRRVESPAVADRRHRLVLSGILQLPLGLQLSGIADFRTSLPFNPVTSFDLNSDGYTGDLPPGVAFRSGCRTMNVDALNAFRASRGLSSISGDSIACPQFVNYDMRLSKIFRSTAHSGWSWSRSSSTSSTERILHRRSRTPPRRCSDRSRSCQRGSMRRLGRWSWPCAITSDASVSAGREATMERDMSGRRHRHAAIVAAFVAAVVAVSGRVQPAPPSVASFDLQVLFERGAVFQDRNGDGVIDFVDARIVLSENPTASEVAAAADVAARLGFETSAMNIPLSSRADNAPLFVVGTAALARVGLDPSAVGTGGLRAGEGIVSAVTVKGRPGVVVTGGDDAGTRAAAQALAGRLPHVWDPGGPTVSEVAEEVRDVLTEQGVVVSSVSVPRAYVNAGSNAFARLAVVVQVASAADMNKGQAVLRALRPTAPGIASARSPGARTGGAAAASVAAPEKPRLSYPGAQLLHVRLATAGATPAEVELTRVTAPEPGPLGRRPGSGPKENLDLSTLYTNEGFFGDSNNNLIPDRVDVVLSPAGEGVAGTVDLAARIGLEGTGVSVPLAIPAPALGKPESEPTLVLIGDDASAGGATHAGEKVRAPDAAAGRGSDPGCAQGLRREERAGHHRGRRAWRVASDAAGRGAVPAHVGAREGPHDDRGDRGGRAAVHLGAQPAGQAATALYKLDRLAQQLAGKELESARVLVSVEKPADGLAEVRASEAAARRSRRPSLTSPSTTATCRRRSRSSTTSSTSRRRSTSSGRCCGRRCMPAAEEGAGRGRSRRA